MPKQILFSFCLILLIAFISCQKDSQPLPQNPPTDSLYFPPANSSEWQTLSPSSLHWNESQLNDLYSYLQSKDTKAFIIVKAGKIVTEKYFGTFTADSLWYWASAGKTMTAFLIGIAQQQGLLSINDKTSKYLGTGWTSEPVAKENLITINNQLTMTSGLDDGVADDDCTSPDCLVYKADAGTRWAYHNGVYTLLDKVVEAASGLPYNTYFQQKIRDKIGMNGLWLPSLTYDNIYYSNARSMARFGLLMLNKGNWNGTSILGDTDYFNHQINTSQNINLSYGYLTWLNGKNTYMVPTSQFVLPGYLIPNAPADMYAALGKYDQKIYVVPSQQLVVIRMGNDAGGFQLATDDFDDELWGKLKTIIGY